MATKELLRLVMLYACISCSFPFSLLAVKPIHSNKDKIRGGSKDKHWNKKNLKLPERLNESKQNNAYCHQYMSTSVISIRDKIQSQDFLHQIFKLNIITQEIFKQKAFSKTCCTSK